jgi:5'-3' exoribonuclease 2
MLGLAFSTQSEVPLYLLRESTHTPTKSKKHTASKTTHCNTTDTTDTTENQSLFQWSAGEISTPQHNSLQYLNIAVLSAQIVEHIESYGDIYSINDRPRVIRDYVTLCFLLGNDFLPHSPSLCVQDKGIDVLLEAYVPLRKQTSTFLTYVYNQNVSDATTFNTSQYTETHINQHMLLAIFQKIGQQEDYLAGRLHTNILQKRKWMLQQQRFPKAEKKRNHSEQLENSAHLDTSKQSTTQENTTDHKNITHPLEHEIKHLHTLPPFFWSLDDKILPGTPGWKRRYYIEVERVHNMQDVHHMCRKYIEGLYWIAQYYFHGCFSTVWYYPYVSAPLFSNMEFVLQQPRIQVNRLLKRHNEWTHTELTQLLTIMPKVSLEKYVYTTSMCNFQLEEHPVSYKLIPFSKRFRWECSVRLPPVNDEHVHKLAQQLMSHIASHHVSCDVKTPRESQTIQKQVTEVM